MNSGEDFEAKWHDAAMAFANDLNIGPLVAILKSRPTLSKEQWGNLAYLVKLLFERAYPKCGRGRPSGTRDRWRDANYMCAKVAEAAIAEWKRDKGKKNIPHAELEKIVEKTVNDAQSWAMSKRKRPQANRVIELLRGSRRNRLP